MGTVKVIHPDFPDGYEFEIPGLGFVPNNQEVEVDETNIALFKSEGQTWPESGHLVIDYTQEVPSGESSEGEVESGTGSGTESPEGESSTDGQGEGQEDAGVGSP